MIRRPVAQRERHGIELERGEVDPQRVTGLAAQRRELVEQAGLRADPVVLDATAEAGELAPRVTAGIGLAGEREQRERERRLQRGRGGEAGALVEVALDRQRARAQRVAGVAQLGDGAADEGAPALRGRRLGEGERVLLADVERACGHLVAVARLDRHRDAAVDRERQREPVVVVGVLPDEVDAAGSAGLDGAHAGDASAPVRKFGASSGAVRVVAAGARCPPTYWWYGRGHRVPAAAGRARRNASNLWTSALALADCPACASGLDGAVAGLAGVCASRTSPARRSTRA